VHKFIVESEYHQKLLWGANISQYCFTLHLLLSLEADPNYKPVFSADESSSKSPLKTGMPIAKKFDSAHKKQFSRYVIYYTHNIMCTHPCRM
jgi:hypothetical protein